MSVTTCTSTTTRRKHISGKRTNSLGWAKSDCHTCAAKSRHCDRRRPRCSACLSEGVICSGYVQQLNWERGASRLGKPRSKGSPKDAAKPKPDKSSGPALPPPSAYVFVDQIEGTERPRRKSRNDSKSSESSSSSNDSLGDLTVAAGPGIYRADSISPTSPLSTFSFTSADTSLSTSIPQSIVLPIYPQVGRHPGDIEDALSFYHSSFSYTTLTYATKINPWQSCLPQINDNLPCVRYAAVAVAQRQQAHMSNKPEGLAVLRLKAHALSIFASRLNELSFESGISTSLLLIALDYAETGYGNWTIHLRGAFRILEAHGGIVLAESRPNLRSQMAMLVWYDVNAALIARCGPVFPRRYLEALMMWQADDEWSILALNGLPDGMFLFMHDLAVAVAQPQDVRHDFVAEIHRKISEAEINIQGNRHLASMSQVWKLGLLLYCTRVFPELHTPFDTMATSQMDHDEDTIMDMTQPSPSTHTERDAHSLALQILDIVDAIPSHSNFQKQCLMPIVLAACEMTSEDLAHRGIALDYSERWKSRTGIWIFDSGLEFMRGVWARNEPGLDHASEREESKERKEESEKSEEVEPAVEDETRPWVPWTDIYPPGVEYGFLFG